MAFSDIFSKLFMYQLYAHYRVRHLLPVYIRCSFTDALLTCDYMAHYN